MDSVYSVTRVYSNTLVNMRYLDRVLENIHSLLRSRTMTSTEHIDDSNIDVWSSDHLILVFTEVGTKSSGPISRIMSLKGCPDNSQMSSEIDRFLGWLMPPHRSNS